MNLVWIGLISAVSLAVAFQAGHYRGYLEAESRMLKTNPPSQELEMACLGLWVGEQNNKYYKKENK